MPPRIRQAKARQSGPGFDASSARQAPFPIRELILFWESAGGLAIQLLLDYISTPAAIFEKTVGEIFLVEIREASLGAFPLKGGYLLDGRVKIQHWVLKTINMDSNFPHIRNFAGYRSSDHS